jgi:hypothetical protein
MAASVSHTAARSATLSPEDIKSALEDSQTQIVDGEIDVPLEV